MNKKFKRTIATITAAATMFAVGSFFSSCGGSSAEDKYLNLPDDPVIFWEYYEPEYSAYEPTVYFRVGATDCAWIYSKTPIDVTTAEITINDSYFYYYSYIEEAYNYETDCSEKDRLELFMEYNGADWEELYDLYGKNRNDYLEEINNWQARYDKVKDNISLYIYKICVSNTTKEVYNDPTKLSEYNQDLYNKGVLKLYAPENEDATAVTTATLNIGGKTITHEFGKYSNIKVDSLNMGVSFADEKYNAYVSFGVYKNDENASWNKRTDGAVGELFIIASSDEVAEEREWFDVTLKDITSLSDYITIEPTEVKYINTLGVGVSEEWDGSELTLKARNQIKEDIGAYAFAVYFNINSSHEIPSYAYYEACFNIALSVNGSDDDVFVGTSLPHETKYNGEYYAYMADGVDVFAREKAFGYGTLGDWSAHHDMEPYTTKTFWDKYLLNGSI